MAKPISDKKPVITKAPLPKEKANDASFAFGRENYMLLLIALSLLFIGYILMSGGRAADPNIFNEDVFSFRRITLAPLIVMAGYALGIYAIVKKAN